MTKDEIRQRIAAIGGAPLDQADVDRGVAIARMAFAVVDFAKTENPPMDLRAAWFAIQLGTSGLIASTTMDEIESYREMFEADPEHCVLMNQLQTMLPVGGSA